ncbi:MAG: hypothetical protein ACTSUO_07890 [Candidatus Thorarchaeota archaeon]
MSSNIDVMYRLIWNTNGWRAPSGGFIEADYTWGSQHGFSHEEWCFQTKDALDGYVYTYVFSRPAKVAETKDKFRVVFYSISPEGKWYLVGEYAEAEIATKADISKLDKYFESEGIYDERTDQVLPLTVEKTNFQGHDFTKMNLARRRKIVRKDLKDAVLSGAYVLKCPVEKVIPYPGGMPIETSLHRELLSRGKQYIFPFYPSDSIKATSPLESKKAKRKVRLDEGTYWRLSPQNQSKILKRHNRLSNKLVDWLEKQNYRHPMQEEMESLYRVDVEFFAGKELCRAELKICGSGKPLWSIREAIGQLLQYNLYGNREPAKYWFIVLDVKPDQWDFDFIKSLRTSYTLPIWLGWEVKGGFEFEWMP